MTTLSPDVYERLGTFYLGRHFDLAKEQLLDQPLLYDSSDLVTHAVIVGMTGSGKTGLGISLIEEAAIDGVPVLAIDPKGDLANLLLTFPNLAASDFRPWIDEREATRQGLSADAFAAQEAAKWSRGLSEWGQDGERIRRLRAAAELAVFTPGSRAGRPLSMLRSLAPPAAEADAETFAEAVTGATTGLLTLLGIASDGVPDREAVFLGAVIADAWSRGQTVELEALVQQVQQPPITRIGAMEVEAFYPASERFALAMKLNTLLASPASAVWRSGEPMEIPRLLFAPDGRPRVAIVSVAHLDDAQRQYVVAGLLDRFVGWMRGQSGTASLRALLYMDEVAGYMPPVAAPATKAPLLRLLKQARAFGVGVVLATQNPVDLDYKGLANAGTWFLGRLQTQRDKDRLLDGLESAVAGSGGFDRSATDRLLSALPKRTFYLHNVHDSAPAIFQTRWAMSYLCGPLSKEQLARLPQAAAEAAPPAAATPPRMPRDAGERPVLAPGVESFFLPAAAGAGGAYQPLLFAAGSVRFTDTKRGIDVARTVSRLIPFGSGAEVVDWSGMQSTDVETRSLLSAPPAAGAYQALPPAAAKPASYAAWQKEAARRWLESEQLTLAVDSTSGLVAQPAESETEFRARVALHDREQRDRKKDELRQRWAPKAAALDERLRRARQAVDREQQQVTDARMNVGISVLGTVAGALFGRKAFSAGNLGRAASAARGFSRSARQAADVKRAEDTVETLEAERGQLEADLAAELAALEAAPSASSRPLERIELRPKRGGVSVERLVLVWRLG